MSKIKMTKKHIFISLVLLLILILSITFIVFRINAKKSIIEISYVDFVDKVNMDEVKIVSLSNSPQLKGELKNGTKFQTDNPRRDSIKEELLIKNIEVVEVGANNNPGEIISAVVLITMLGGFAFYLSKKNSNQASKEYDKMSSIELATEKDTDIRFRNIAGNEEAKENIMELVDFIKNPQKYAKYGARMPKGVILYGPPGTGKTLMAKALASEAGVDFLAVSGSDFVQVYAGLGAGRVRSLFKRAKEKGKCVIFIDEIDAIGKKRDRGGLGGSDESDRTLNALLTEMSGFKDSDGIIIMAATNRLDSLDEALLRPGRFDRQIEIGLPDLNARFEILKLYSKERPIAASISLKDVAEQTVYFSGAKLENLMNEAAINAAREGAEAILQTHIDRAFYTVVAGDEKKDRSNIRRIDREITAYHEAGHAIATKLLCPENKVTKVTIIPSTKGAGGFSMNIPPDKMYNTKKEMLNNIKVLLAGRVSEELIFGEENITTGASNDIQRATEILVAMVKQFGMSEEIGLINYDVLFSRHGAADSILVDITKKEMQRLYNETRELLNKNIGGVKSITKRLLEKETLIEDEIDELLKDYFTNEE